MFSFFAYVRRRENRNTSGSKLKPRNSLPTLNLNAWQSIIQATTFIQEITYNLYLITIDDTPTFVVPNTIFGISCALTRSFTLSPSSTGLIGQSPAPILYSVLQSVVFNWTNLLVFDLANQRSSGQEDLLNKPWRPIPSKRMSETQMKHWLLLSIPVVLMYNHLVLGVGIETCLLIILTWAYNDLGGGDENWIIRNGIISAAFGLYNIGSFKIAAKASCHLSTCLMPSPTGFAVSQPGLIWTAIISAIIFTTMHIQDLKDIAGDRARGRKSAPIIYGRRVAGWTIAVPVMVWSVAVVGLHSLPIVVAWVPIAIGAVVAWRCITLDEKAADRRTWQLWCLWTAILYIIPPFSK